MQRVEKRWDRRGDESETVVVEGSIAIAASRETGWGFLRTPEAIPLTTGDVTKAFQVPGTPRNQTGGQLVVVHESEDGLVGHIHEIAVLEPGTRIVTVCLSIPYENWESDTLEDAAGGGILLRSQSSLTVLPYDARAVERESARRLWDRLRRTKRAIESGVQFPSQRTAPSE